MRCGKYVSPACTQGLAPVQVRDTFAIFSTAESNMEQSCGPERRQAAGGLPLRHPLAPPWPRT